MLPVLVHATSVDVKKIYAHHFYKYDTINNMPWDCGGNSYDLYLELVKAKLVNEDTNFIVHIFYEYDFKIDKSGKPLSKKLYPKNVRKGHAWWAFHAFLVLNGQVFDQYLNNQPTVLNLDQYMNTMWRNENLHELQFQLIPADEYHSVQSTGYKPRLDQYPVLNYSELRSQLL